jgi:hypothetical protein
MMKPGGEQPEWRIHSDTPRVERGYALLKEKS